MAESEESKRWNLAKILGVLATIVSMTVGIITILNAVGVTSQNASGSRPGEPTALHSGATESTRPGNHDQPYDTASPQEASPTATSLTTPVVRQIADSCLAGDWKKDSLTDREHPGATVSGYWTLKLFSTGEGETDFHITDRWSSNGNLNETDAFGNIGLKMHTAAGVIYYDSHSGLQTTITKVNGQIVGAPTVSPPNLIDGDYHCDVHRLELDIPDGGPLSFTR
jgi:hypothetical protein